MRMARTTGIAGVLLCLCSIAHGQEQDQDRAPEANRPIGELELDGTIMPFSLPARVGQTRAFAWGCGGYVSARKCAVSDTAAEVQLWGPIALRGGASFSIETDRL